MFLKYLFSVCVFLLIDKIISETSSSQEESNTDVSLIEAVKTRNETLLKELLDNGASINIRDEEGKTPLIHAAALKNNSGIVKYLIDAKADPYLFDRNGTTALHAAAREGNTESVKLLFRRVHNHESRDKIGRSPLYLAVQNNHSDTVSYFSQTGADLYSRDSDGLTPLHLAAKLGLINILDIMLENNTESIDIELERDSITPLLIATFYDQPETAEYLIKKGATVESYNNSLWTPIHAASFFGRLNLVKTLIDNNATVDSLNAEGRTPLYIASEKGNLDVINYLIEQGADTSITDNKGNTLSHAGIESGNATIVKYLVEKKVPFDDNNSKDISPLMAATIVGNVDIIKYLVESGANINTSDLNDTNLIHVAAHRGDVELLKYFSEKNVPIDSENYMGMTPLHFAVISGSAPAVEYLVEKLADKRMENLSESKKSKECLTHTQCYAKIVNFKDNKGRTSLILAAEKGHLDVVKILLQYGGDYNLTTNYEKSPFHAAAGSGYISILKYFLENLPTDINAEDLNHKTAVIYAAEGGQLPALKYLLDNGADTTVGKPYNLIHAAAANGQSHIIEAFKEYKNMTFSSDDSNKTPAWYAANSGQLHALETLINLGANITHNLAEGAVIGGKSRELKYLLENGVNTSTKNDNEMTLLGIAIGYRQPQIVKDLVEFGANINTTEKGKTLLEFALFFDDYEIADILLKSGVNINQNNDKGLNALHIATFCNNLKNVKYLLDKGANVTVESDNGRSPLDYTDYNYNKKLKNLKESKTRDRLSALDFDEDLDREQIKKLSGINVNSKLRNECFSREYSEEDNDKIKNILKDYINRSKKK